MKRVSSLIGKTYFPLHYEFIVCQQVVSAWTQRSIQRSKTEGLYHHTSFLVCKRAKKKERENVEILYVLPGKENVGTTYLLLLVNAILLTFHDHTA